MKENTLNPTSNPQPAGPAPTVQTFTVTGMTCGHCGHAVTAEFSALPGVTAVAVDLPTGAVTVHSVNGVDAAHAAFAADEAGYELRREACSNLSRRALPQACRIDQALNPKGSGDRAV
jgi:copper chaperone CopZ